MTAALSESAFATLRQSEKVCDEAMVTAFTVIPSHSVLA